MRVGVHRLSMASPGDVSELRKLIADKVIDPAEIVASIGKTGGNGGANDFTRALATQSAADLLAAELGITREEAAARAALAWSGGCEGVLSPHITVFTRTDVDGEGGTTGGLAISVQRTRHFRPEEVGRTAEVTEVAAAVTRALSELQVAADEVHYVQVKGPLLTPAGIADAAARGEKVVTSDPNRSKAYARGATALGVAMALGEVTADQVADDVIAADMSLYSAVANTSAGGELTDCEVIVFANSPASASPYRIAAVFAKAEAPVGGMLRGHRTTMLSDADINYERHARAALGGVIASVTGDPRVFVSGGTEHQCPPGQAPIAAIVRLR